MAPPPNALTAPAIHPVVREVTEDTPPDLLEGTMDLLVILPTQKSVRMTVNRRTPMMDLLIQITTANKINPGGHIVQVRNERGIELPYKPSTPIGALDTTTIEIVPKNRVNEYIIVKKPAKLANQPFEQTFRLQVHLPRNQLYVMRVSPKTLLEEILQEVCQEKNLDYAKYEIRHPVKLDEKLALNGRVGDFGLQELTVVSRNSRINSSVSTADIMALQSEEGRNKGCLDSAFKHSRSSVGESSVSSESAASAREISPSRSDDSRSISPLPPIHPKIKLNNSVSNASSSSSGNSSAVPRSSVAINNSNNNSATPNPMQAPPRPKKRAAPPPPSSAAVITPATGAVTTPISTAPLEASTPTSAAKPTPRKKDPPREPPKQHPPLTHQQSLPVHHSRHSSDSSGYHESSVVSEQHEPHRLDRQTSVPVMSNLPPLSRQSTNNSTTNLTSVFSVSSTSLASSNGGAPRKRKAPKPPGPPLKPQSESLEEEIHTTDSETSSSISHGLISTKSGKSRASSLEEVEVDVHVNTGNQSVEDSDLRRHQEKEIEILSSSSASSLSSPTSASESTSSSPLPVDLPQNQSSPQNKMNNLNSLNNSSKNSPANAPKAFTTTTTTIADAPVATSPVVEEPSRPSSANSSQAATAAPLPPPRTKPRIFQSSLSTELDPPESELQPQPLPKPKPRPDRKSTDTVLNEPNLSLPKKSLENETVSGTFPLPPSGNRNPLSRFGVKVLPDNALRDRAEHMSKEKGSNTSTSIPRASSTASVHGAHKLSKPQAPPKPKDKLHGKSNASTSSPSSSISIKSQSFQKKDSSTSTTSGGSSVKSKTPPKAPPGLSKSSYTGKGSVRSLKSLTDKGYTLTDIQIDQPDQSVEYDSDNLEENLELFDVNEMNPTNNIVNKSNAKKQSIVSTASEATSVSISSNSKSSISSQDSFNALSKSPPNFIPELTAAILKQKESARVSGIENVDKAEKRQGMRNSHLKSSPSDSEFTRTWSDRQIGTKSAFGKNSDSSTSTNKNNTAADLQEGQLNRWQNLESLHEIDDLRDDSSVSKTNLDLSYVATSTTKTTKNSKSTFSLSTDDDIDDDTAHDVQDDPAIHSSGSEVSYTDSGIPATENVTPSPVDIDVDIDQENDNDNDRAEKDALSVGSSRRSSLRSENSDQWREILEAKIHQDEEAVEKAFGSMLPESFANEDAEHDTTSGDNELNENNLKNHSSNFEMIRPQSMTNLSTELEKLRDEDEQEHSMNLSDTTEEEEDHSTSDDESSRRQTKSTTSPRKISKSESFSHKSEFDVVKMKRRNYAGSKDSRSSYGNKTNGSSAIDLRKSSFLSSSEEDLPTAATASKKGGSRVSSNSNSKDQRTTSMQNLSLDSNNKSVISPNSELNFNEEKYQETPMGKRLENREDSSNNSSGNNNSNSIQKATSLMDIQDLQPDIADNPVLMQTFRSELEAQFEQWKEQFLQKHLGGSKSGSIDSGASCTNTEENITSAELELESKPKQEVPKVKTEEEETKTVVVPVEIQKFEEESASVESYDGEDKEEFDPEKPQIVYAVAAAVNLNRDRVSQQAEPATESVATNVVKSETVVKETIANNSTVEHEETAETESSVKAAEPDTNSDRDMNRGEVAIMRQKKQETSGNDNDFEAPQIYKYSGPPTIKMSTWGDRPKRTVSVKKDKDYIMGFGQQDPKTVNVVESKPTPAPINLRVHSFNGGPVVQPSVNKVNSLPAPNRGWSGINGVSAERSVVSSWKQRLEESEKERRSYQSQPPAEIDIYEDSSAVNEEAENPLTRKALVNINRNKTATANSDTVSSSTIIEEPPNEFTWSVPENNNKNLTSGPRKTLVNINKSFSASTDTVASVNSVDSMKGSEPMASSFTVMNSGSTTLPAKSKPGHTLVNINKGRRFAQPADDKPVVFQPIDNVNALPRSRNIQIVQEDAVDSVAKPAPVNENGVSTGSSLFEKKKFFQGIKPVESNGKEAPTPAVNMKSSIATIQNMFEQRKPQQQPVIIQRSMQPRDSAPPSFSISSASRTPVPKSNPIKPISTSNTIGSTISSTQMVQKVLGKSNAYSNIEIFRRTPSPASSTTSTLSSASPSSGSDRFTPSPTISDGPNNTIRISTMQSKPNAPSSAPSSSIKNVGNKSIIIVSSAEDSSNDAYNNKNSGLVSNNIFKQQFRVTGNSSPKKPVSIPVMTMQNNNANTSSVKVNINGSSGTNTKAPPPVIDINMSSPPVKTVAVDQATKPKAPLKIMHPQLVKQQSNPIQPQNGHGISSPSRVVNEPAKMNGDSGNVPPPPPPPPMEEIDLTSKSSGLGTTGRSKSVSALNMNGNAANGGKAGSPTSPTFDPRSEINNAIKNSGGIFGLRKTGSTMLLK